MVTPTIAFYHILLCMSKYSDTENAIVTKATVHDKQSIKLVDGVNTTMSPACIHDSGQSG